MRAGVGPGTAAYEPRADARAARRRTDVRSFTRALRDADRPPGVRRDTRSIDRAILARAPPEGAPDPTPAGVRRPLLRCLEKDRAAPA